MSYISKMNKFKNRVITILFLSSFIIAQPTIDLIGAGIW